MSFPAWSTFLTGLDPGDHGLFDFTQKVPGAYRVRFANAGDRAGASLAARVARAAGRVLVLGVPDPEGNVILLRPDADVPLGGRMF